MKSNKKGSINENTVTNYIYVFIFVVVLLKLVAKLLPEAQSAGQELNDSGAPLGSFFTADGLVWLLVMAGIVILMVRSFLKKGK